MDGDLSGERAAKNQSLYRSINEKIEELNKALASSPGQSCEWICECADTECTARIAATLQEYETVRSNPRTFIIVPGHVLPQIERVVEENDRFMIAEKLDDSGRFAEAFDPRTS